MAASTVAGNLSMLGLLAPRRHQSDVASLAISLGRQANFQVGFASNRLTGDQRIQLRRSTGQLSADADQLLLDPLPHQRRQVRTLPTQGDRKSTRLNSSHITI